MTAFLILASLAAGMAMGWAAASYCIRKREARRRSMMALGADLDPIRLFRSEALL